MTRAQAFQTGFFAALGVAALVLLLLGARYVLFAALDVITPFVIAIIVALLLDPVTDRVQARFTKGKRLPAVLIVFLVFLLLFGCLVAFVVPRLVGQAQRLAENFPTYFETVRCGINQWLTAHPRIGPVELPPNIEEIVNQYSDQISRALQVSVGNLAGIIAGSVSRLLSIILIPIITFYLLADIDRLRARLLFLLPEPYRSQAQRTALDIGGVFGNYVRGLMIVCLAYAVTAVIILFVLGFWVHGLGRYALLLGTSAGLLYAVPYVGALLTLVLSAIVTLATGNPMGSALLVIATLLILNQVFDNGILPRIVGGGVGLHPVISLFALLMGGQLFGLWGMLLSVPIAASIQVVLYRLFPRLAAPTPLLLLRAEETLERQGSPIAADVPAPDTVAPSPPPAPPETTA